MYFLRLSRHSFLPIFFALVSEGPATPGRPCGQASRAEPWHLTTSSMRRTSSPLKNGSCSSLMGVQPTILQALTSKGDLGGVTGVRWTLSLMSTNINKDYQAWRGGNVMFQTTFAFLYTYHMQINTGTASFPLSQSIHIGADSYPVLLHRWSALSLYDTIFLWPSCTISSYTSTTLLGRCTSTFA